MTAQVPQIAIDKQSTTTAITAALQVVPFSFDLENTEQASIELLTELKAVYRKTADEVEADDK